MKFGKNHSYMTIFQNQSKATKNFQNGCHFQDGNQKSLTMPVLEVES